MGQYLKDVRRKLTCSLSVRSVFLGALKSDLLEYANGRETISVELLCAKFGTPAQIADGFLDRSDYQELLQKAKKKLQFWRVISVILAVFLILITLYFMHLCMQLGGHYTITGRSL